MPSIESCVIAFGHASTGAPGSTGDGIVLWVQPVTVAHATASTKGKNKGEMRRFKPESPHSNRSQRLIASVRASENVKDPLSPAGRGTTTTFVRSRTEVTVVMPRASPADRKNPICSPGDG